MARLALPTMFMQRRVLSPERKLWRAVLAQACSDADADAPPESAPDAEESTRTIARRFLRAASPGEAQFLALVCGFADIPYDRVVLWARKRYPADPLEPESIDEFISDEISTVELSDSALN